jgi:hypothetical protein
MEYIVSGNALKPNSGLYSVRGTARFNFSK